MRFERLPSNVILFPSPLIEDDLDEIPDISPVRLETEADEITDINPVETEEIPELLYSDRFIAVINKPAGIPMNRNYDHPEGITEMMRRAGEGIPVHRLDMETSGILVLGKTRDARRNLHNQFGRREVRKTYLLYQLFEKVQSSRARAGKTHPVGRGRPQHYW